MSATGDLNGMLKVAYKQGEIENLIPPTGKIMDRVDFVGPAEQPGKQFECPVVVTNESGFTRSLDTQTAYTLRGANGMVIQSAIVQGTDLVLQAEIGYQLAGKALSSKNAFQTSMPLKMENMMESASKRLETTFLYGQTNIGQAAQQSTAIGSSMLPVVIDDAAWAAGIWAGAEGSLVVFSVPATGAVVDSLLPFEIARVDTLNKTVYFKVPSGGTASLANLETAVEAAGGVAVHWDCDVVDASGSISYLEGPGLKKIFTNTGLLFNINAANYNLWAGNSLPVTGQLNFRKINQGISLAVQRGLTKKVEVFVNPDSWTDVMSDLAAQRVFDYSYDTKKAKNGVQEIEFYGQNGSIKLVPYNLVKEGDAFIFPSDKVKRVGSRELSFRDPVSNSEDLFYQLPTQAGAGLRVYTNQTIFCQAPAQCTYISGIVNSNNA